MGTPVEPKPAKYFIAFLVSDLSLIAVIEAEILATLGEIDARGTFTPWLESKFYEREMGARLRRGYCSLTPLRCAAELAAAKLQTQAIEDKFRDPVSRGRRVNLDPGYLDTLKVVLA